MRIMWLEEFGIWNEINYSMSHSEEGGGKIKEKNLGNCEITWLLRLKDIIFFLIYTEA